MPKASRTAAPRSAAETAALAALSRFAARGAYAEPADPGAGPGSAFMVFTRRGEAAPQAVATVPGEAIAWAHSRGWLERDGQALRYRIAAAGVAVLRRARCSPSPAGASPARPRPAATARQSAAAPVRVPPEGSLAWLRRRRDKDGRPLITEPQFAAGERLAADFWHAQLTPRVTANWSAVAPARRLRRAAPGVGVDLSDAAVAARQRIARALAAVGPELAGILLDVCCYEAGLEAAGRAQGWPQRAAKVVLQLALTRLARHYGLLPPEPPPGARRLRHWGAEDYRPSLAAWR
jgi:hypothetical protein